MDLLILESTVIHNCHNTPRHVFEKTGCNAVITEQVETVGYHVFSWNCRFIWDSLLLLEWVHTGALAILYYLKFRFHCMQE